jgi:ABC-type Fe3+-hydroxamate transport system substrate-binding protein
MIIHQGNLQKHTSTGHYQRIISLVPSLSWLLFDLNLYDKTIGVTKFCKGPNSQELSIPKIGGTKNPDLNKINELNPDLILANKEENRKEDIELLAQNHLVYLSEIKDLQSMYEMMEEIGVLTGTVDISHDFISRIKLKSTAYSFEHNDEPKKPVTYLIWKQPLMTIGQDTFIHYMLELAGFRNIFADNYRYPVITYDEIRNRNPEFTFLSSEPYPFNRNHLSEFKSVNPVLVDGRMFSWYGTFTLQSFDYLNALKRNLNSNI